MLKAYKNKTSKTVSEELNKTTEAYFSGMSAGVNGNRVSMTVNHAYLIPKEYHVSGLTLSNFKARNSKNYKATSIMLLRAAKEGRSLTPNELLAIAAQMSSVRCDVTFPDGEVLIQAGRFNLLGTISDWSGDYKKAAKEVAAIKDKGLLWQNMMTIVMFNAILEKEISDLIKEMGNLRKNTKAWKQLETKAKELVSQRPTLDDLTGEGTMFASNTDEWS